MYKQVKINKNKWQSIKPVTDNKDIDSDLDSDYLFNINMYNIIYTKVIQ